MSDDGRARCAALADELVASEPLVLVASTEPKARETAELVAPALGLDVQLSDGLRETARRRVGWLERDELERGIRGLFDRPDEVVFGEESGGAALARFSEATARLPARSVVVSHGTVISLYVAEQTGLDAYEVWQSLELPDIVEI